jgi:hypothetical protein
VDCDALPLKAHALTSYTATFLVGRPRLLYLVLGGFLGLLSFISECGFGGIRKSAPIRRFVLFSSSDSFGILLRDGDEKGYSAGNRPLCVLQSSGRQSSAYMAQMGA